MYEKQETFFHFFFFLALHLIFLGKTYVDEHICAGETNEKKEEKTTKEFSFIPYTIIACGGICL